MASEPGFLELGGRWALCTGAESDASFTCMCSPRGPVSGKVMFVMSIRAETVFAWGENSGKMGHTKSKASQS